MNKKQKTIIFLEVIVLIVLVIISPFILNAVRNIKDVITVSSDFSRKNKPGLYVIPVDINVTDVKENNSSYFIETKDMKFMSPWGREESKGSSGPGGLTSYTFSKDIIIFIHDKIQVDNEAMIFKFTKSMLYTSPDQLILTMPHDDFMKNIKKLTYKSNMLNYSKIYDFNNKIIKGFIYYLDNNPVSRIDIYSQDDKYLYTISYAGCSFEDIKVILGSMELK